MMAKVTGADEDAYALAAPESRPASQADGTVLFSGTGEMRARVREFDWASTALGPMDAWPQSLRTIVGSTLGSAFPQIVLWGPDLVQVYNDGYIPFLGTKHPWGLGLRTRDCWPEAWPFNGPIYARVFQGETVSFEDQIYQLLRRGPDQPPDDVYITLSYSPIPNESGEVGGVLVTLIETTARVAARRIQTERDTLLQRVETERTRLMDLFREAPAFLALVRGPDHVFEMANDAYDQVVGYRDIIGKPVLEALPEVEGQGFIALLDEVLRTGVPFIGSELPIMLTRSRGQPPEERFLDFVYQAITDPDGMRTGIVAHGSDVTEHVRARHALEAANAQLAEQQLEAELTNQQLQENAAEMETAAEELQATMAALEERTEAAEQAEREAERAATRTHTLQLLTAAFSAAVTPEDVVTAFLELGTVAVGAKTGVIMLLNPERTAFSKAWGAGYPDGFLDAFHNFPADAGYAINAAVQERASQWVHSHEEADRRYPPLATVYQEAGLAATAAVPLFLTSGTISGALVFNFARSKVFGSEERDFIEALAGQCAQALERSRLYAAEREARAEAQEANASKSRFLANMSHELRQPLNAITGYSELMKMGVRGPVTQQQRDDLDRIRSSSAHLTALIGDILEFARIEAGQLTYNVTDVPLDAALAEVATFVAPQIAAKQLRYSLEQCGADVRVRADRDRFIQAVLNLLTNATKYTERGGSITVSCATEGIDRDMIAVRVADTGIGIPAPKLPQIFDPFVQAHRSLNRPTEGVGLGLAIARDIARHMGGDLSVESVEGVGSTFTLTLPLAAAS